MKTAPTLTLLVEKAAIPTPPSAAANDAVTSWRSARAAAAGDIACAVGETSRSGEGFCMGQGQGGWKRWKSGKSEIY